MKGARIGSMDDKIKKAVEPIVPKIPLIKQWIDGMLEKMVSGAQPANGLGFKRLPDFFSGETLGRAQCIFVPAVPKPPLSQLGIRGFEDYESGFFEGITYGDVYFVRNRSLQNESVHFHELVHVLQWKHLGPEKFILAYIIEILKSGYRENRLEKMAYSHQALFDGKTGPYDVEKKVKEELDREIASMLGNFLK